jgi:hypothetical protein
MSNLRLVREDREERITRVLEVLKETLVMEDPKVFYSNDYHITEDVDQPYYILCYWNLGSNGFFGNKNDVIDRMMDILQRPESEHYQIEIIDVDTGEVIQPIIKDIRFEEVQEVFYSNP